MRVVAILPCLFRVAKKRPRYSVQVHAFLISTLIIPLPAYRLAPDLLVKAQALDRMRTWLSFGGTAWTLLLLGRLVRGRAGERIAAFAERITQRDGQLAPAWLAGLVAAPLWLLLLACLGLPGAILAHRVSLAYGLSIESWASWWLDLGKSTLLNLLLGTLVLSTLYLALRRTTRWAWLCFWAATLPFILAGVYLTPLLIDPIFNHFTPLAERAPSLVEQLERVAARGGLKIPPARMFVMDASRRTMGMNAYVTGFGNSKRIVVWDTTLPGAQGSETMKTDELLAIYGHEQGHYVLGHIAKGIAFSAALLFLFYWVGLRMVMLLIERRGVAWHIQDNPADWSSLGLVLWVGLLLLFVGDPLANAFSRWEEHQADVYGQEVLHGLVADPQAVTVEDFNRLGRVWLEDPAPNRFVVWWTYSHPPTADRAAFAASYDPWKQGAQPRYFSR